MAALLILAVVDRRLDEYLVDPDRGLAAAGPVCRSLASGFQVAFVMVSSTVSNFWSSSTSW